ncbi:MAG: NFACT RNA binding domain-containing protein [Clostridia bacterium]|nr:NFACT RNA binding domain-containing protein [Clostridia bacterium]
MAFDGITISALISEIKDKIIGGRIDKIYQPESDEIILSIRSFGKAYKLLLTANPSNPKFHFTNESKNNPLNPPLFCMVMRKHLQSGKILSIHQPNFDRIINIYVESMNEMGDYSVKKLILEIMGRHSNLILTDENNIVLDCIKHISHDKSSVREVLPGIEYIMPPSQDKINTIELNHENFYNVFNNSLNKKAQAMIYQNYTGISPVIASEICNRAGIDASNFCETFNPKNIDDLYNSFNSIVDDIKSERFDPLLITNDSGKIVDFSPISMTQFAGFDIKNYDSMSELVEDFYRTRDFTYRINQKTQDLKKLISQNIERCVRKKEIQTKTLKDIENRDELRLFGELITANIYSIKKGMTTVNLPNFYSENYETVAIPLDGNKTPSENAQKYFKAYNKAKRTFDALQEQIVSNDEELEYLEGVLTSVGNCTDEQDIKEIRQELRENGYIKKTKGNKSKTSQKKSKPLHYISSDGYDIYVGKNNFQNDELTLKFAKPRDMWFHTKNIPGSHVIVVYKGEEYPNSTLTEAAEIAAYYSKAQGSSMVAVDYTEKRNVKKPNGAKPGMVIYETNKTAYVDSGEAILNKIKSI